MLLSLSEASSLFELLPLYEANSKTYKLLPYHSTLTEASHIEQTEQTTFKCKLCNKPMGRKKMRQHIGSHILKDNLENVCGFCGVQGCDIVDQDEEKLYLKFHNQDVIFMRSFP